MLHLIPLYHLNILHFGC